MFRSDFPRSGSVSRARFRATKAFSLVEVVFAIGVFSFCIITLLYLLSAGLVSSRESQEDSAMAAALRNLDSQLRMLPATQITNTANYPLIYYFDSDGNILAGATSALYRAKIQSVASAQTTALTGTTNFNSYLLWSVEISHPAPIYASTNQMILGRALYGSGFGTFYE